MTRLPSAEQGEASTVSAAQVAMRRAGMSVHDPSSIIGIFEGALLEVRVFRQGTFAARLVPVRNFFAVAHAQNRHAVGRPD
jgi:hypothetical protein